MIFTATAGGALLLNGSFVTPRTAGAPVSYQHDLLHSGDRSGQGFPAE